MDLLDSILANTGNNVVITENHDASKINWIGGMSDPGEMIGCQMYQQLRRHAAETDASYAARIRVELALIPAEHAQRISEAMGIAAVARFGMERGADGRYKLFTVGDTWHGLGVSVSQAVSSAQAITLAGMTYKIVKIPMAYTHNGQTRQSPDCFAIVRDDNGAQLGTTGSRYKERQFTDAFGFLDSVLQEHGATYESAGIVTGGQKAFITVNLPNHSFRINGKDETLAYAVFAMAFDGVSADYCFPTSVRPVCQNTFRQAQSDKDKGIRLTHVGNLKAKLQSARAALNIAVNGFAAFRRNAETMIGQPMAFQPFLDAVLDATQPVSAADANRGAEATLDAILQSTGESSAFVDAIVRDAKIKEIETQLERRKEIEDEILGRYENDETNGVNGMRGTAWAGFQAITEFADHNKIGRQRGTSEDRASRRFESILSGDRDEIKQVAYQLATATATA